MGISTVRGEFKKLSGSVNYDPADPSKTSLEATIDATTVDTRVDMRDKDLRMVQKSKGVSTAVAAQARKLMQQRGPDNK